MARKRTLYMGTTKIDAQKTAGEVIAELVKAGATSVNTDAARIDGEGAVYRGASAGDYGCAEKGEGS